MTSVVFALIIDLALKRGHRDIKGTVVEIEFGEIWKVTINGKRERDANVPPFHAFVECNGWPVTILTPKSGGFYSREESPLQTAFNEAARVAASKYLQEYFATPEVQARVAKFVTDAVEKAFSEDFVKKLTDRMINGMWSER